MTELSILLKVNYETYSCSGDGTHSWNMGSVKTCFYNSFNRNVIMGDNSCIILVEQILTRNNAIQIEMMLWH